MFRIFKIIKIHVGIPVNIFTILNVLPLIFNSSSWIHNVYFIRYGIIDNIRDEICGTRLFLNVIGLLYKIYNLLFGFISLVD